jgi:hypothetical protein
METKILTGRRSLVDEFFPRTEASIKDLDQAVALLAGMTVLGFGLYNTADARYKKWWLQEETRLEEAVRRRSLWLEMREVWRRDRIAIHSGQIWDEENIGMEYS